MKRISFFVITICFALATNSILAQTGARQTITLENVADVAQLGTLELGASPTMKFTPDSNWLIVQTGETDIQVIDPVSLNPVATLSGTGFQFSPDEQRLLITLDTVIEVYDLTAIGEAMTPAVTIPYDGFEKSFSFSSDQRWLAIVASDSLQLFDMTALSVDPLATIAGDRFKFDDSVARLMVLDEAAGELKVFDLTSGPLEDTPDAVIAAVTQYNAGFGFVPNSDLVLFTTDEAIVLQNTVAAEQQSYDWADRPGFISWSFSPDNRLVAFEATSCSPGYCNGEIRILEVETLAETFTTVYDDSYVSDVAFTPDSKKLLYATNLTGSWSLGTQYGTTFETGTVHITVILETLRKRNATLIKRLNSPVVWVNSVVYMAL